MKKLILLAPLSVFLIVAMFFAWGLTRDPSDIPSALINKPLPSFALPPVHEGEEGLSTEDLKGEVVLLNVFASWCVSCRIEHPFLMKLAAEGEIPIYGLNWKDEPGKGREWLDRFGNPYVKVGDDAAGRVALDLGVTGAPETFVIDREGRVRFKAAAPITEDYWNHYVKPVIDEVRR